MKPWSFPWSWTAISYSQRENEQMLFTAKKGNHIEHISLLATDQANRFLKRFTCYVSSFYPILLAIDKNTKLITWFYSYLADTMA